MFSSGTPKPKIIVRHPTSKPRMNVSNSSRFTALADDHEDDELKGTQAELSKLFTPAVGVKSRGSVHETLASIEQVDKEVADLFKGILTDHHGGGTLVFPMPDQQTQTKLTQALHIAMDSHNIDKEVVKRYPDAAIIQAISVVNDV